MSPSPDSIRAALRTVVDPDLRVDVITLGSLRDLEIADGSVRFTLEQPTFSTTARDRVREQAETAVRALPGIESLEINMAVRIRSATAPEHGRPPLPGVKNVVAVGAGKGGVGKTTVSVNLALALAKAGARVGILDGDMALIKKSDTADTGDIVVALIDDEEATLKRFRRRGASIALEPANTSYEVRILPPNRERIQGKLIGLFRRY